MKKIILLLFVSILVISCKTSNKDIEMKNAIYYKEYMDGKLSSTDYQDLCYEENELQHMENLHRKAIRQINRDKFLHAFRLLK